MWVPVWTIRLMCVTFRLRCPFVSGSSARSRASSVTAGASGKVGVAEEREYVRSIRLKLLSPVVSLGVVKSDGLS